MSIARIVEEQRKTTQSGKAKAGRWTLEMERTQALRPDPLTGWAGSGDTKTQVRSASYAGRALACPSKGLEVHLAPTPPAQSSCSLRRQVPLGVIGPAL